MKITPTPGTLRVKQTSLETLLALQKALKCWLILDQKESISHYKPVFHSLPKYCGCLFKEKSILLPFFVIQKEYDGHRRKGLQLKIRESGVHGKLNNWVKYFVVNRTIQTKVNNGISSKHVLEEGLPQGHRAVHRSCCLSPFTGAWGRETQSRSAKVS